MEGDLQRALGRNIRRIRQARGLTQEAMAEHLSVSAKYLSELERGKRNLSLQSVERLAIDLKQIPLALLA
jgi:transcriptional regulator with XRE-family HTH domain